MGPCTPLLDMKIEERSGGRESGGMTSGEWLHMDSLLLLQTGGTGKQSSSGTQKFRWIQGQKAPRRRFPEMRRHVRVRNFMKKKGLKNQGYQKLHQDTTGKVFEE